MLSIVLGADQRQFPRVGPVVPRSNFQRAILCTTTPLDELSPTEVENEGTEKEKWEGNGNGSIVSCFAPDDVNRVDRILSHGQKTKWGRSNDCSVRFRLAPDR